MLDLHCHILPGLDDGAPDYEVSLAMAAMAADSGVTHVFATPHCNTRSEQKNYRSEALIDAYHSLQHALDEAGIPLRILAGSEVLARGHFFQHLAEGDFMTLNASRDLLLEFYFDEEPEFMERCLRAVEAEGLVPVVAHPERYFCIQDRPELAVDWAARGHVLQLNKDSLLGGLGEKAWYTASALLLRGAVSVIASDAHHYRYRDPHMGPLLECLRRRFPAADPALLLHDVPLRIAKDLSL